MYNIYIIYIIYNDYYITTHRRRPLAGPNVCDLTRVRRRAFNFLRPIKQKAYRIG